MSPIRTRFAPSPTGYLHIGGARTALFCYLFARHHGGAFVLRIEDTDLARSTPESVQAILDGMSWLGLQHDEGPFYQTRRFDRYREVVQQLLDNGQAYRCWCSPEELDQMRADAQARGEKPRYNGYWRDRNQTPPANVEPVIRFRNPMAGEVRFLDAVKGEIVVSNTELDDLIIQRSDGTPTYNLTVVVDDMDMQISHVIRGDDHVNNTPRQINIFKALGAECPIYAHLPMILGEDGKRLSKRHGAVSVMQYAREGYLPEALLNYLVRLGWSHGDQEIFSMDEMIEKFRLEDVNRAGGVFDTRKLDWVNQQYLMSADTDRLAALLAEQFMIMDVDVSSGPALSSVVELYRERANTLGELALQAKSLFVTPEQIDASAAAKHLDVDAWRRLARLKEGLSELADWDASSIDACIKSVVSELGVGFGKVGMPLRLVLTGSGSSPSMAHWCAVLGQPATLQRLNDALSENI